MGFVNKTLRVRQELRRLFLGWFKPRMLASEDLRSELNVALKDHWKPEAIDVFELILEIWEPDTVAPADTKATDDRFIVFIDPDLDVDWTTKSSELGAEANKAISFAESIGARRCKHLPREQILEFKRLVGQAIVNAIRGESEQSRKLAEEAALFLRDRTVERSRSWTLISAHIFVVVLSGVLALCHDAPFLAAFWQTDDSAFLWLAVEGGILGAYLSVVQRAGRGEWDAAAGRGIHYVEVFTKLFAGAILGGIAFAISRSQFAPPFLKAIIPDNYSALALGVASGFLERLIPKIISNYSKLENQKQMQKNKTQSDTD